MFLFPNGSDHKVITCYLELHERGEDEHINVLPIVSYELHLLVSSVCSYAHANCIAIVEMM